MKTYKANIAVSILVIFLVSMALWMAHNRSNKHTEIYTFYRTTLIYLSADVQHIEFEDITPSKHNDFIYSNIMMKLMMLSTYPQEVSYYNVSNLTPKDANELCLASVFIMKYKPKDTRLTTAFGEYETDINATIPELLQAIDPNALQSNKTYCGDVISS